MYTIKKFIANEVNQIKNAGFYKEERIINSPQNSKIELQDGKCVLNLCPNNYLGLAAHPEVIEAARSSYDRWGYGLSSVRFICGTQAIHKQLEQKISEFLERRIQFCIPPVSMPIPVYLKPCYQKRMR
jgi:glycine C-acetyltransferase